MIEHGKAAAANIITVSRMLFSLLLLFFPPRSFAFAAAYLLCGVTDVLDGFVARKLHTESEKGAMLDSAADLLFAVVYAVKILPLLALPLWILLWTAVIAAAKIAVIVITGRKAGSLQIEHSFGNRLTGLLLFFLPAAAFFDHPAAAGAAAALVCTAASAAAISEIRRVGADG